MSRTLVFNVYGDLERCPLRKAKRQKILNIQQAMNQMFTWTHGKLDLELYPYRHLTHDHGGAGEFGRGSADVHDDDWNAALTVRFLRWLSSQLPEWSFMGLSDEGDYIPVHYVGIDNYALIVDIAGVERDREYLRDFAPQRLTALEQQVLATSHGEWFKRVPATLYRDRPEVAEVGRSVTAEQFEQFTLEDVADRITFPWQIGKRKSMN
jgi:hypothetical protein